MATKRKRNSLATPSSTDDDTTPEHDPTRAHDAGGTPALLAVVAAESPFQVQVLKSVNARPRKRRAGAGGADGGTGWSVPREENALWEGGKVPYVVAPGVLWDDLGRMKKYRNFEVNNTTFSVHDFVYVNHSEKPTGETIDDDESHFWVARVLEVRAEGPHAVYLRVFWMYFPDELPEGRQYYHGKQELVASNLMEIIDAQTVSEKVSVTQVSERDDAPTANGLYWRQHFDAYTNKLSPLRRHCKCKRFHNPDKLLVRCPNPKCAKWMHDACIIEDVKERTWDRLATAASAAPHGPDADTPDTVKLTPKKASTGLIRDGPAAQSTVPPPKKRRGRKVSHADASRPWGEVLEGRLVMQPLRTEGEADGEEEAEEGEEDGPREFTGLAVVVDSRGGGVAYEEVTTCLFCRKRLDGGEEGLGA